MRAFAILAVLGVYLGASSSAFAEKHTAQKIIDELTSRTAMGFGEGFAQAKLILQDDKGNKRVRVVDSKVRKKGGGAREATIRFIEPKDVRGVTVLQHKNKDSEDDLYLYLPAFKRTRRIAAADKDGQFMGTDFTYGDMEQREIEEAKYEMKPDAEIDGVRCYAIVAIPHDQSQYSKLELFVRKDNFLAQQIKYYDRKGKFLKVYRLLEVRDAQGDPIAAKAQMWTKRTGHSTFIVLENVDRKAKPTAAEFRPEGLGK